MSDEEKENKDKILDDEFADFYPAESEIEPEAQPDLPPSQAEEFRRIEARQDGTATGLHLLQVGEKRLPFLPKGFTAEGNLRTGAALDFTAQAIVPNPVPREKMYHISQMGISCMRSLGPAGGAANIQRSRFWAMALGDSKVIFNERFYAGLLTRGAGPTQDVFYRTYPFNIWLPQNTRISFLFNYLTVGGDANSVHQIFVYMRGEMMNDDFNLGEGDNAPANAGLLAAYDAAYEAW